MNFELRGVYPNGYTFGARSQIVTSERALTALIQFSLCIER